MRIFIFTFFSIILFTGCSGVQSIEIPTSETEGEWISEVKKTAKTNNKTRSSKAGVQSKRMYVRKKESKYVIKDEPYSIASKKKDPELLGPQRTYNAEANKVTKKITRKKSSSKMTKGSCISMIGEAKFKKYVKKYGGEAGALRRCLILQRLRG